MKTRKPCSDCPFKIETPLIGSPDWCQDVLRMWKQNKYFQHSCHKTDPDADNYTGGKKKQECMGHLMIQFNEMDGTPGRGGVYESIPDLIQTYLKTFLGDKFDKMKLNGGK